MLQKHKVCSSCYQYLPWISCDWKNMYFRTGIEKVRNFWNQSKLGQLEGSKRLAYRLWGKSQVCMGLLLNRVWALRNGNRSTDLKAQDLMYNWRILHLLICLFLQSLIMRVSFCFLKSYLCILWPVEFQKQDGFRYSRNGSRLWTPL